MGFADLCRTAFEAMGRNRMRTLLSILGIVIGIASVVAMLGIGEGSKSSIRSQITSMGTNMVTIMPNRFGRSGVRTDRVKFLAFVAAGALTGLAAFVNVVKVGSITATAGSQLETQILIALVLGGLPITGGAKVRFSNIIVGTLMYTVLNNGLVMLGYETQTQQLIKGVIFLIFVALTIDRKALKVIK